MTSADTHLRQLERAWQESQADTDAVRYYRALVRAGQATPEHLEAFSPRARVMALTPQVLALLDRACFPDDAAVDALDAVADYAGDDLLEPGQITVEWVAREAADWLLGCYQGLRDDLEAMINKEAKTK